MWVVTSKPTIYADRIVDHFGLRGWIQDVHGSELSGTDAEKRLDPKRDGALEPRRARDVGGRGPHA